MRPTLRMQSNHLFLSICAVLKLECLNLVHTFNCFVLRAKLYVEALQHAFSEHRHLKAAA
ncbi:transposase, IS4 family protein [Thiorhodococcus drewsii AZ1]|uniref:Transposase, IS4 family protein n=1 Tax=Thiorhodococcus drewsii AZ1 TaxID=765913 RepID=G2E0X6_9GAMM|nr:transposase, IS4 family protein [Thiorhodococcus drewsii AZ1]